MTAYLAGLAFLRADDPADGWPDSDAVDGVALAVLAAAASFCGEGEPVFNGKVTTLATRARFNERTVRRALARLAAAGLVERTRRPGGTDLYRLVSLHPRGEGEEACPSVPDRARGASPDRESGPSGQRVRTPRTESPDTPDRESDDPPESSRPPGREARRSPVGSGSADAAPSPPAPTNVERLVSSGLFTERQARAEVARIVAGCKAPRPEQRRDYIAEGVRRAIARRTPSPTDELAAKRAVQVTSRKRRPTRLEQR